MFVKRLDGHMALANSEALRRAGVHEDFAAPAGGAVVRDASGRLTGLLKDAAMDAVTRAMPPLSADGLLVRARAALRHAAELGVTSIQDMTSSAEEFSVYEALLASGELTARISSMQNYGGEYAVDSRKSDWLARGGRKFFSDGSMGSSTAAFFEPYSDDAGNAGLLMHDPDELERLIVDTDAHGIQPVVHAIGDRANALVLDILERLHARRGRGFLAGGHGSSTRRRCGAKIARASHGSVSSSLSNRVTVSTTCAGRRRGSAARGAKRPTTSARSLIPGHTSRSERTGSWRRSIRCSACMPR